MTFSATGLPAGLAIDHVDQVGRRPHRAQGRGRYPVTLTARDGALSSSVSLTWTVLHTPCSPFAQNDTATTPFGTAIDVPVLDNDIVPAACIVFGAPTLTGVTQPQHGAAAFDAKLRTVTYTPAPAFTGIDTFTYTIANSAGDTATATVTVTVAPAPDTPIRNGVPESRYNAVGTFLPGPGHSACTGTLVSPFVVLTAAQCVQDDSSNPVFEFSLGLGRTARVTAIRVHPAFDTVDGINLTYDVALVSLDRAVAASWSDIVPTTLNDGTIPVGIQATAVGANTGAGIGTRTSGALFVSGFLAGLDLNGQVLDDVFLQAEPGSALNQMFCSPAGVGGPLLYQDQIVGIASFRNVLTCAEPGSGYYVSINHIADWIRTTTQDLEDLTPPTITVPSNITVEATGPSGQSGDVHADCERSRRRPDGGDLHAGVRLDVPDLSRRHDDSVVRVGGLEGRRRHSDVHRDRA